ncbi:MAG: glycosyltransferase family 4 protein, partial [Armatimonadota bacterium]|nr:glycosyltransferase family 4 protein [Armatimonadota bacterium]
GIPSLPIAPRNSGDLLSVIKVAQAMRSSPFDVVHGHFSRDYVPLLIAARLAHKAAVFTRHNFFPLSPLTMRAMAGADRMLAVSDAHQKIMVEEHGLSPDLVTRIYPWVDLEELLPLNAPRQALPVLGMDADAFVFGMVSRLEPIKRIETFIHAAARVKQTHPEVRYVLVGQGPLRTELEELVSTLGLQGEFIFTGFVEDINAVFREFSAFVSTGDREPFPYVTLEAMAFGMPVIGARAGGTVEIIRDCETGFLVAPGDDKELAQAMLKLVENSDCTRSMGDAGRSRTAQSFSADRAITGLEGVYWEAISKRSTRAKR